MKKLMIGAILSVAFACGIFVYTEWDNQRFVDSLSKPPTVEQTVDTYSHPHEDAVPATPSNTGVFESETVAEKDTTTEQMSEDVSGDDTQQTDAAWQTDDASESGAAGQTDDEHEHQSTQKPSARKISDPSEMDADELADRLLEGLLQRFGDIPEVHTFIALKRKKFKKQPLSLDEHIAYTAAQYHLWPDAETKKTLDIFLEKRASESLSSTQIVR